MQPRLYPKTSDIVQRQLRNPAQNRRFCCYVVKLGKVYLQCRDEYSTWIGLGPVYNEFCWIWIGFRL